MILGFGSSRIGRPLNKNLSDSWKDSIFKLYKLNSAMERYYFKTRGQEPDVECTEKCMFKNTGTMIGSANCQECEHHLENNRDKWGDISWLKCAKIEEATGRFGV